MEVDVIDHKNNYFTKMYVGSELEEVNIAFSSAAKISVINSANCQGCDHRENKGFEYQKSHSIRKISEKIITYSISEEQDAKGILVSDNIKMNKETDKELKEIPFLLINKWK